MCSLRVFVTFLVFILLEHLDLAKGVSCVVGFVPFFNSFAFARCILFLLLFSSRLLPLSLVSKVLSHSSFDSSHFVLSAAWIGAIDGCMRRGRRGRVHLGHAR